jgi:hypothetical protein
MGLEPGRITSYLSVFIYHGDYQRSSVDGASFISEKLDRKHEIFDGFDLKPQRAPSLVITSYQTWNHRNDIQAYRAWCA